MTPKQIELVQSSFAKVVPIAPQAAEIFYARLFELAPGVRALFTGDSIYLDEGEWVVALDVSGADRDALIEELYLRTVSRMPTGQEREKKRQDDVSRAQATRDAYTRLADHQWNCIAYRRHRCFSF